MNRPTGALRDRRSRKNLFLPRPGRSGRSGHNFKDMKKIFSYLVVGLLGSWLLLNGCRKIDDSYYEGQEAMLEFSTDTLRFDTVFTQLGSATRILKVYNPYKEPVLISRIYIPEGTSSKFRLNVDGVPGNEITDVKIAAEDSIYLFGEVTIDPDQPLSASPFIINDEILFETNGNTQRVVLEAWGQNANYIPSRFNKGGVALLSCDFAEVTWDDPKPYVIYGILVIDSCTLNLPPGARVYVHGGIARTYDENEALLVYNDGLINVFPKGRLNALGTLEEPVIIQGDRLEEGFQETSGQWVGIRLAGKDNVFEHVTIKNSLIGVLVDSAAQLTMRHGQIYNTDGPGLIGRHGEIEAVNCLFYNNGDRSVQLGFGGDYDFSYCTLASYGVDAPALSLSNGICYDLLCEEFDIYRLHANFRNSIVFGSRADEIVLSDFTGGQDPFSFVVGFDHCLVRVRDLLDPDDGGYPNFLFDQCNPCINADFGDPIFVDPNEDDYHLDTLSIAEGQALPLPGIPLDLEGNDRDPATPDIGCFEYQYQ